MLFRRRDLKINYWLQDADWSFIRGSAIVSTGMLLARVLGLGFSLILAKVFSPDEFGHIQYTLAVASVLAVAVHPFGQHVIARFISTSSFESAHGSHIEGEGLRSSEVQKREHRIQSEYTVGVMLSNCWIIFLFLIGLTLLVAIGFSLFWDGVGFEVLIVVVGIALFYAYWGLSRGHMRSELLTAAYLGSNVFQLIAVCLLIWLLEIHSTMLALTIYGLSYVPVIFWLQTRFPLPIYLRSLLKNFDWSVICQVLRFSIPITFSHAAYMIFVAADLLFLNRVVSAEVVGQYALAKTLATAFSFVPMGIATLLMPKIARAHSSIHLSYLYRSVLVSLLINMLFLGVFWLLVQWFVKTVFGPDYWGSIYIYLILAFSAMALGIQSLVAAVYVGKDKPEIETIGRVVGVLILLGGGWFFIPNWGELGAAISVLSGSIAALAVYVGYGFITTPKPAI